MSYIILVDDDDDFATAVVEVLHDAGHEVTVRRDTDSAVGSMEQRRPDLAILDVMFPESSSAGFALARTMRLHNAKLKGIPILFLTAVNARFPLGFSDRDLDGKWLPAEEFLEKPVDLGVLKAKVAELLARKADAAGPQAESADRPREMQ